MFVLKFYMDTPEGCIQTTVCSDKFEVFRRKEGHTTVTTFTMRDGDVINGTDYHLATDHYRVCFVENSIGKTIQHIKQ